ncbi:MAG: response regulator transcription factor [Bacteroidales bacterium]|nr:response regulator transcription factor [Lentimicrobiaceae bacterium]MDD5695593.1 response regulator transcription factor [Bacteroidales bacterium]
MSYSENPDRTAIRIAIVEDDRTVREGLQMLLNGSPGFACVAAYANGEDAVADIPQVSPDVVLMDINLPGINGIECILALKELHFPGQFIMLTVFEDADAIFRSLSAGATGYLLKQTPAAKLLEAIQDVYRGGSPMSGEIARKVVQSFQHPVPASKNAGGLTKREEEILDYLMKGFFYKEIAGELFISTETVRTHIRNIYEKLQVRTRSEAILKYFTTKR